MRLISDAGKPRPANRSSATEWLQPKKCPPCYVRWKHVAHASKKARRIRHRIC